MRRKRQTHSQIAWDKIEGLNEALTKAVKADGLTATQAARHLSRKFGLKLSHSSVISRAHRMDLHFKEKPKCGRVRAPKPERHSPPSRARIVNASLKVTGRVDHRLRADEPKPLGNDGACLWLHGEPAKRLFCGHPRKDGSVYCAHHHARAYDRVSTLESERRARLATALVAA